ncbi:MAG: SAM-dependent methyltransferase [Eubacterium sp.]|nr:SAM-dependent methyltransferase [Eubacterium sp.]
MAVRLSARLSQIASYIGAGESVCDVGTDHGFIPIFLAEQGGHDPVIMSDVSKGSLAKAVSDAEEELSGKDIPQARLGDGLDVLEPGEVDDIVIAGMGGLQILDIMTWDFVKTLSYRKYILQPRRDSAILRKWLEINKFTIIEQCIVPENGRFSEILCVSTDGAEARDIGFYERKTLLEVFDNDPDLLARYEYPDGLIDPSETGIEMRYFNSELDKSLIIIDKIRQNSEAKDALDLHLARLRRLEKLCGKKN